MKSINETRESIKWFELYLTYNSFKHVKINKNVFILTRYNG